MKVSELTGSQLDEWVGKALGWHKHFHSDGRWEWHGPAGTDDELDVLAAQHWAPSANWDDAGDLIESVIGGLFQMNNQKEGWCAHIHDRKADGSLGSITARGYGPTPLVAAMRAFVTAVFGDTVPDEIPPATGQDHAW